MDLTTSVFFILGSGLAWIIKELLFRYLDSKKTTECVNSISCEEQIILKEKVAEDLRRIDNKHKVAIIGEGVKIVPIYPNFFGWKSYPHEHGDLMHDRDLR